MINTKTMSKHSVVLHRKAQKLYRLIIGHFIRQDISSSNVITNKRRQFIVTTTVKGEVLVALSPFSVSLVYSIRGVLNRLKHASLLPSYGSISCASYYIYDDENEKNYKRSDLWYVMSAV